MNAVVCDHSSPALLDPIFAARAASGIPLVAEYHRGLRKVPEFAGRAGTFMPFRSRPFVMRAGDAGVEYQSALHAAHFRLYDRRVDGGERRADAAADPAREHAQPFQVDGARMIHDRGLLPADEPGAIGGLVTRSVGFV